MPLKAPSARARSWPTAEQELLLRAALDQGPAAVTAWQTWQARIGLDAVDPGSYRLLPLVYQNLTSQAADDPELPRLRGVYRRTWYANQLALQRTADLVRVFQDQGIKTLLLDGPELVLHYYPHPGLRPIDDLGLLIPTEQVWDALRVLEGQHFIASPHPWGDFKDVYVQVTHAFPFIDPSGTKLDLHWHLFERCCQPTADADFWAAASALTLKDTRTHRLDPADQLLYLCASATRPGPRPTLQRLADASMVIRTSSQLDWNRLIEQAQQRQLLLPLRATLDALHRTLDAPIPPAVVRHLQALSPSPAEQLEQEASIRLESTVDPTFWLRVHGQRYRQTARPRSIWQQPLGFARFLQYTWGLSGLQAVPGYALKAGLRRIGRALGRLGARLAQ